MNNSNPLPFLRQLPFDNIHIYFDRLGVPREINGYKLQAHERLYWLQFHFEAEWVALEEAVEKRLGGAS